MNFQIPRPAPHDPWTWFNLLVFVSSPRVLLRNPLSSLLLVFFAARLGARWVSVEYWIRREKLEGIPWDSYRRRILRLSLLASRQLENLSGWSAAGAKCSWKTIFSCFMTKLSKCIMHNDGDAAVNQETFTAALHVLETSPCRSRRSHCFVNRLAKEKPKQRETAKKSNAR